MKWFTYLFMLCAWAGYAAEPAESQFVEIQCTIKPTQRGRIHPRKSVRNRNRAEAVNANWTGYVAHPSTEHQTEGAVTYVAGSWTVPVLDTEMSNCCIWVGMDGHDNNVVEQIGTAHGVSRRGVALNYAWFETYPKGAYIIDGFPVEAGDLISARMGYKGEDRFKFVIFNHTKGVFTIVPAEYTTIANAPRSNASWVVEGPFFRKAASADHFNVAVFNYCSGIINGLKGTIDSGQWTYEKYAVADCEGVILQPVGLSKNGTCFINSWVKRPHEVVAK